MHVHHVQGHLHGGPVVGLAEHVEVDGRVFVSREAEEAAPSFFQGLQARVDRSILGEDPTRVAVVDDLMELPEIKVVGLRPAEAVLKIRLGIFGRSSTTLGHQK